MAPTPTPGQIMRAPTTRTSSVVLLAVAIPLLLAPFVLAAGAVLFGLVLLAISAAAAAFFSDRLAAVIRWHAPRIEMRAGGYPLGSEPVVIYHRAPRRVTDIAETQLDCLLTCQEVVRYQSGTDTVTDRHNVVQQRFDAVGTGTADGFRAELTLPISAHAGAPSLELENNSIRWSLKVQVRGPRMPKDDHVFDIDVVASLDEYYRARVQDSLDPPGSVRDS